MYLHVSLCECTCVYVPILFSCAHSTGQKMESTGMDPSRWNSSLPTWRRTSSAEYFGSTTLHGYGDTVGSCFKQKVVCLGGKKNKYCICLSVLTSSLSALLPIFFYFCNLFVFPAVITTANLFCDCTPHTSHSYAGLSIQAVQKQ